jgi:hypothetical protein
VRKLHEIEILKQKFSNLNEGIYHEYYRNYYSGCRVVPSVWRRRRLLLEETTVGVTSHIILKQKAKFFKKRMAVKLYEEIGGVICSYNVSCDFYVDWL